MRYRSSPPIFWRLHLWPFLVPMPLEQPHSVFGIFNACTDIEVCSSLCMVRCKHYKRLGEFALEVDFGRQSLAAPGTRTSISSVLDLMLNQLSYIPAPVQYSILSGFTLASSSFFRGMPDWHQWQGRPMERRQRQRQASLPGQRCADAQLQRRGHLPPQQRLQNHHHQLHLPRWCRGWYTDLCWQLRWVCLLLWLAHGARVRGAGLSFGGFCRCICPACCFHVE